MVHFDDAQKAAVVARLGQARAITVGAVQVRNATALVAGRYLFFVESGEARVRTGGSDVAATATDMLFRAGTYFSILAGGDGGTTAAGGDGFISIIQGAAGGTVTACGSDDRTSGAQPPAWA